MEEHNVSLFQLRVPSADHSSNGVRPRPEGGQQRGIPVQEAPTSHPHRSVCRYEWNVYPMFTPRSLLVNRGNIEISSKFVSLRSENNSFLNVRNRFCRNRGKSLRQCVLAKNPLKRAGSLLVTRALRQNHCYLMESYYTVYRDSVIVNLTF